jgi:sugar phosphate permease
MPTEKVNVLDIVLFVILIIMFGASALVGVQAGEVLGSLFLGGLAGLCAWLMARDLRKGVRAPTRYEWFKAWMILRPLLIGAIGLLVITAVISDKANWTRRETIVPLLLVFVVVWGAAVAFALWRAPHRREGDMRYKKRMGYKE